MKPIFISLFVGLLAMILLTGCLDLRLGGGSKSDTTNTDQHPVVGQQMVAPTLGQQLVDLQKAREAGAISDQEYQDQRAKLLGTK
ncbi:MAG TPA: SHOCT domain-containing protein [Candidatus Limnocylindrales bacterium]|nr:SHOCT domain-containing protein [Candidatus Limnocylindrales bacterium]